MFEIISKYIATPQRGVGVGVIVGGGDESLYFCGSAT